MDQLGCQAFYNERAVSYVAGGITTAKSLLDSFKLLVGY